MENNENFICVCILISEEFSILVYQCQLLLNTNFRPTSRKYQLSSGNQYFYLYRMRSVIQDVGVWEIVARRKIFRRHLFIWVILSA